MKNADGFCFGSRTLPLARTPFFCQEIHSNGCPLNWATSNKKASTYQVSEKGRGEALSIPQALGIVTCEAWLFCFRISARNKTKARIASCVNVSFACGRPSPAVLVFEVEAREGNEFGKHSIPDMARPTARPPMPSRWFVDHHSGPFLPHPIVIDCSCCAVLLAIRKTSVRENLRRNMPVPVLASGSTSTGTTSFTAADLWSSRRRRKRGGKRRG